MIIILRNIKIKKANGIELKVVFRWQESNMIMNSVICNKCKQL